MSTKGKIAWNRGKPFPHTKEWEERRLAAVREAVSHMVHPKGYHRPLEHTRPMLEGYAKARIADPAKYRQIAINNLSQGTGNLSGENSPNWKGGITRECVRWRNQHSPQFEKWRLSVLERDHGQCKMCGVKGTLHVHHIVGVSECKELAFLRINGVTLCRKCHYATDNYGGAAARRELMIGAMRVVVRTIPHKFQDYETVGNWARADGVLLVLVSDMGNRKYEILVALHELVESHLCQHRGISEESITKFDLMFEKERAKGLHTDDEEPGDDKRAPYRKEHAFAEKIERMMARALGVNWQKYSKAVMDL